MTAVLTYCELPDESDWDATVAEWLAGLFLAPLTASAVTSYRDGIGAMLLEDLGHQPDCLEGTRLMQLALRSPQGCATLARRFGRAFMQLFEGAGGPLTVSPYESAHLGPRGRLFQGPAADMDRLLCQAGLMLTSGTNEPSDHVSVELALLARMLRDRAHYAAVASLVDRRLLNWVPGFANALGRADGTGFYAGAASLLVGFLSVQRRGSHPWGGDASFRSSKPPDRLIKDVA